MFRFSFDVMLEFRKTLVPCAVFRFTLRLTLGFQKTLNFLPRRLFLCLPLIQLGLNALLAALGVSVTGEGFAGVMRSCAGLLRA